LRYIALCYTLLLSLVLIYSCGTESTPVYTLTTSVIGEGLISPSGGEYEEGEVVTLTGIPNEGWIFLGWSGDFVSTSITDPLVITMDRNINVIGTFERRDYPLTIAIEGEGTVKEKILSTPKATEYPFETVVQLTPNPSQNWEFKEWSGDVSSTENVIEVFVNDTVNITATFVEIVVKEGEVYNPSTGKIWMDRNLGASRVAQSSTDPEAYGDLYQWGRADDGHQKRNSGTTSILNSADTAGHGDFILVPNSPFDWRSPQNDNLWQGVNGINNPCPSGYRLPTEAEWDAERQSWSSNNRNGAFASQLKLPVAGNRRGFNGSLSNAGSYGYYWSGTADGTNTRHLYFNSNNALMLSDSRANGISVRCIKD